MMRKSKLLSIKIVQTKKIRIKNEFFVKLHRWAV
jgi:hypothetical protein